MATSEIPHGNGNGNGSGVRQQVRFKPRLSLDNLLVILVIVAGLVVWWADEKSSDARITAEVEHLKSAISRLGESMTRQFQIQRDNAKNVDDRLRSIEIRLGPQK